MNLTPASSSDLPSEAIFTRVSESGTRLMQTAIFKDSSGPGVRRRDAAGPNAPTVTGRGKETRLGASRNRRATTSKIAAQAHLQVARWPRGEPALDGPARHGGILCEGAKAHVAPVEHVPKRPAQLPGVPRERQRQIGDKVVGQSGRDVRFVAPQPLPAHVAGIEPRGDRQAGIAGARVEEW